MLPAIILAVACFAFVSPVHATQTVPYKINFQGRLTNASGVALTGSYDMQFKLYTAVSGGTFVWGETRTAANANAVSVANGLFNVLIGEGTAVAGSSASLQAAVTANSTLYIEVTVGAEIMTPRSQFGASAYAINSDMLDGLDATAFGQLSAANSWTNTNLIRVTSSAALSVQNASGISMLTADTSTGELKIGNYNGGTSPIAGKLVIANTSNANTVTLATGVTTASYTLTLPTAAGANGDCVKTSDNLGTLVFGVCGAGVTTLGSLDGGTANANGATISGSTLYLQSASVSYAGLINTTAQTFTGAKTFNDDLTLAAAKTVTLVGGDTASRPASPVEGMMYYDTATHQMVQWNGSKWVSGGNDSYLVAASNSSQADKDAADYVASGTGDQTTIQSALDRADPNSVVSGARKSGKVYLFAGTYTTNDVISIPNDTTLAGSGRGSLIKFANINGQTKNMITNTDTTTGKGATVRDLQLDGNFTGVNTTGTMYGIFFSGMGGASGSTARQGANIINNWVNNFVTSGIYLNNSPNSTIIGNNVQGNNGNGIYISSSNRSNITNNISQGNSGAGIVLAGAISENVVANTFAVNGTAGIYINGSSNNNTIFGNNLYNNGGNTTNNAIYFPGSANGDFNTITNNTINDTSGTTSNYAINFVDNTSNSNYLADNVFTSTAGTSTINDPAGTNNVYANQPRAEGGGKLTNRTANDAEAFGIQNSSGTAIFTVDTASSQVEIGASTVAGKIVISDGSSNTVTLGVAALAGDYTVDIPTITANDTICLQNKGNCSGGSTTLQGAYDNDASGVADITTSSTAKTILFKAGAGFDAAALFDIQNAAGSSIFIADSANNRVYIGDPVADGVGVVTVLDTKNTTGDPTGVDGAMYYNSDSKSFRCYKNGLWGDCSFKSLRSEWVLREDWVPGTVTAGTGSDLGNIGDNNWTLASIGTGGTIAKINVGSNSTNYDRFGVLQLASAATTASTGVNLKLDNTSMTGVPSNMTVEFDFAPVSANAATALQQIAYLGLHNGTNNTTAPTDGLYFRYTATTTATNWDRCTQATCVSTGVARTTTANQYQRFKIQTNSAGTSVEFFINEVSVGVVSTNLPTQASADVYGPSLSAYASTTAPTSALQWKTDYFQIYRSLNTLR